MANQYAFNSFQLDKRERQLSRDGEVIHLQPKSFDVLRHLLEHAGNLVEKQELMDGVWGETVVTENSLTRCIRQIRAALEDNADLPAYIETVSGSGYRFIAPVTSLDDEMDVDRATSPRYFSESKLKVIIFSVFAFALVLFVVDRYVLLPDTSPVTDSAPKTVVPDAQQSIAVLPFVNMSDDPGNEYFSDGLSEEILNLLARIPGLKVIARTSSFAFKGKNEDVRNIGEALGVKTVLEGSVRKSGDRVRITAQLVDVSDGAHIWSESYDRTMTDIFAIQDDVAAAIIDALQIHVGTNPSRGRPTESPEAYTLFLKARTLLNIQNGRDAIILLLGATELDPDFGEAYELLAYSYWQQAGTSISMVESQRLINDAASTALIINPDLAFAKALSFYRPEVPYNEYGEVMIGAFEQAWRAQPSNTEPLRALINELSYAGYYREAHRYAAQFVELDPLSSVAHYSLGEALYATGHTTEAMAPLAFAWESNNEYAKWFVPAVHLAQKRDDSAIAQTEAGLERDGISDSSWVRDLVVGARDPVNGQAYLDRRIPQIIASMPDEYAGEWQNTLTLWYLLFGFVDRYYELIFEAGPNASIWSDADIHTWKGTVFRHGGFTAHPKYLEVAELLGLTAVWEQRGPPDFCEKAGNRWVCE